MRILLLPLIILTSLILSACAATPKTADEFRKNVSAFIMPSMEKFEVNRPLKEVGATFEKLAPKCLDKTVQKARGANFKMIINWNPTVIVSNDRVELHLQSILESGNIDINKMPPKGDYVMVVDAVPLPGDTTGITMYMSMTKDLDMVINAIKDWASGKSTACPDMAD